MSGQQIVTVTNTDPTFYPLLGPFLSRRAVVKAVGDTIWDDDTKTWCVAVTTDREVLGFAALNTRGRRWLAESLYTLPGYEQLGERLVHAVLKHAAGSPLHATVRPTVLAAYQQAGFVEVDRTARFVKLHHPGR